MLQSSLRLVGSAKPDPEFGFIFEAHTRPKPIWNFYTPIEIEFDKWRNRVEEQPLCSSITKLKSICWPIRTKQPLCSSTRLHHLSNSILVRIYLIIAVVSLFREEFGGVDLVGFGLALIRSRMGLFGHFVEPRYWFWCAKRSEALPLSAPATLLHSGHPSHRSTLRNLMGNLKRHRDEDALKGQAVKNQKALWDKALEVRFLLQKAFLNANRLPQEPVRSSCNSDVVVAQAYSDLVSTSRQTISCMLELEEVLLEKNPDIVQDTKENSQDSLKDESSMDDLKTQKDDDWAQIHRMQCRIAPFRNNSVDRWHGKMQVTSGAAAIKNKLHAFNQKISDQVAGFMRDPSRMIKRMQLRRSSVGILGEVPRDAESKDSASITEQDLNDDGDPELLDDSEFYQQLLKEFFESCDLTSSETTFYALKRLQPKKRKIVDRRASKSRKIRYNVHEKIVNFMAPIPMDVPQIAPKLFDNLFGRVN